MVKIYSIKSANYTKWVIAESLEDAIKIFSEYFNNNEKVLEIRFIANALVKKDSDKLLEFKKDYKKQLKDCLISLINNCD